MTVKNVLGKLEVLLAQDDIRASQFMLESTTLLRSVLGDTSKVLENQISEFDYPAALHELRLVLLRLESMN
jgi:hypothetical protein